MAEASKLELILLAKDKMSPAIQRLLSLLKQTEKEGKTSGNAVDRLTKKLERAPKTDGISKAKTEIKKATDEAVKAEEKLNKARQKKPSDVKTKQEAADAKKLGEATEKAAKSEEKLNNARRKKSSDGGKTKQETADTKKLGDAAEKAAKSEEKLNNAIKKRPRKSGSGTPPGDKPNRPLRRPRNDKDDWLDDATMTGAGAGGLWLSKEGIGAAMSKQEALTEVRNAFYRSSIDAGQLNSQMLKAEQISERLGNKLPGDTATYLNLLSVMKQRGIEVQTILEGAGDAAAYLAVANKEDTQSVGENLAGFGQLFQLKGQEYIKAADVMSRIKTAKGLGSEELIEAAKYFGGRNAASLGIKGIEGAEETVRFLAFLRQNTKMEGSQLGTSSSQFFTQFVKAREGGKRTDPIGELKKLTGQSLNVFDSKGKFLGIENAINEFAKLKGKLSNEQMVSFGTRIAGDEGASVFSAMVEHGNEYKTFNKDVDQSIGLLEKSAKNAENFTNKIEALTGSLSNLAAAGFTPALEPLSKLTDKTNDWVGALTEAAKANPSLARMVTTIISLGSAVLAFKGGSGLLSKFGGDVANNFTTAWKSADTFKGKLGALQNIAKNPVTVSLQVIAAGMTIDHFLKVFEEVQERSKQLEDNNKSLREQYDSLMGSGKLYNYAKEKGQNRPELDAFADKILETMKMGKSLEYSLQPERAGLFEHFWTAQRPYDSQSSNKLGDNFGSAFNADKAANMWKSSDVASGFRDPNVLARLLAKVESGAGMNLGDNAIKSLEAAIERSVGSEKMQQARQILTEDRRTSPVNLQSPGAFNFNQFLNPFQQNTNQLTQKFGQLQQPATTLGQDFLNLSGKTSPLGETFTGLNTNVSNSSGSVIKLGDAAQNVANRLNNLQITPPTFAPIQIPTIGQSVSSPNQGYFNNKSGNFSLGGGRARGGSITKGKTYPVGEVGKEYVTPNASGSVVSNDILRHRKQGSGGVVHINFNPTISVNSDNPNAAQLMNEIKRELVFLKRELQEEFSPDRLAQKVEMAAQRDSERT